MTKPTDKPKLTLAEAIKRRDAIQPNPKGDHDLEKSFQGAYTLCLDLKLSTVTPPGLRIEAQLKVLLDTIDGWIRDTRTKQRLDRDAELAKKADERADKMAKYMHKAVIAAYISAGMAIAAVIISIIALSRS